MRLNALLVDDEMPILNNLLAVLPWDEMDIGIAGLARSGGEALEKARTLKPDIILCDIRMPVMDGIAFLSELRKFDEEAEVIMLTGYAEFEYARSAIRHRVREYVLKPINYDELAALIARTAEQIRARRMARRQEEKRFGLAADLAYEKMVQDLLLGVADPAGVHLPFPGPGGGMPAAAFRYAVMLADADVHAQRGRGTADWERERKLWNFAVRNVLKEALPAEGGLRVAVLQMRDGEWCVVAGFAGEGDAAGSGGSVVGRSGGDADRHAAHPAETAVAEWAERIRRTVLDVLRIRLSVCFCPVPVSAADLAAVYRKLQWAVQTAPDDGRSAWPLGERIGREDQQPSIWEAVDRLVGAVKRNDREEAERMVERLAGRIQSEAARSLAGAEKMAHFCALFMLREMRSLQVLSPDAEKEAWGRLEQSGRLIDIVDFLRRLTANCLEVQASKRTADRLMEAAKDYVDRHLTRDLGVDEVADHLGISASYFSLLFKRRFGMTFVEYVTSERIELAKTMLLLTDRSVTEIGRAVGFAERRYFTKVFQKKTGELPSVFREKHKKRS